MYERKWNVIQDSREIIIHQISYQKTTTAWHSENQEEVLYISFLICFLIYSNSIIQRKSPTAKKDLKIWQLIFGSLKFTFKNVRKSKSELLDNHCKQFSFSMWYSTLFILVSCQLVLPPKSAVRLSLISSIFGQKNGSIIIRIFRFYSMILFMNAKQVG